MNLTEYDYLCHHGILGMKWGIRRYQNPDGSLTPAGKIRYGGEKAERYREKLLYKARFKQGFTYRDKRKKELGKAIKNIQAMSNSELAKKLAEKDRKSITSTAIGATTGAAIATLKTIGGNLLLKELPNTLSDVGFAVPEGLTFKQDPGAIVKTYAKNTTMSAVGSYLASRFLYDRKLIKQLSKAGE